MLVETPSGLAVIPSRADERINVSPRWRRSSRTSPLSGSLAAPVPRSTSRVREGEDVDVLTDQDVNDAIRAARDLRRASVRLVEKRERGRGARDGGEGPVNGLDEPVTASWMVAVVVTNVVCELARRRGTEPNHFDR